MITCSIIHSLCATMGNDGGSIPDRRDLVRNKPKAEQADRHNQMIARWFFCALSKRPLQEPIVSCPLGKLYNKDAILEYLLDKAAYGDGDDICGHIRSLKDVRTLKLTHNPAATVDTTDTDRQARFACPLTLKEMTGTHPFVYLSTCGCVFSQAGLRAVSSSSSSTPPGDNLKNEVQEQKDVCPQCASKFTRSTDIVLLNPGPEEQLQMRETMEARRAAQAAIKPKKAKKRKLDDASSMLEPATKRVILDSSHASRPATPQPAPFTNNATATSRTVANALAQEELKRKHGMSDAVKSLYTSKNGVQKKETFMTRGTFTRYA
ncbi:Rtf2 RING-finger-domain-containing protein [Gautieria morchelliformis]|nr:Rtf2 RING-finger-domain-containing protein [Gautieria morchelliformis]